MLNEKEQNLNPKVVMTKSDIEKWAEYHRMYIAINDIKYVSNRKRVFVPKGTLVSAYGGGCFANHDRSIILANIDSVNGKDVVGYEVRTDDKNFISTPNPTWNMAIDLCNAIEDWVRDSELYIKYARELDLEAIKHEIQARVDIIKEAAKMF